LIPDWTYFHCPGATLVNGQWPENQILIPDWTSFHCPGTTVRTNRQSNFRASCQLIFTHKMEGRCWQREKIDWQEARKFDCRLVRTIYIFCCPYWRVARKSNFDS